MPPSTLQTPHGALSLPTFFPDATRAVIRGVDADDAIACDIQGLMVNVYHLILKPGARVVAAHGGVHDFMGWPRPIAADSGGFQAYSHIDGAPRMGSITPKGFIYRLEKGGPRMKLTPAKCVQTQMRLRADIFFCLDHCTHPEASPSSQRESVEHTVAWSRECRETFDRLADEKGLRPAERPLLFAVVQGGEDESLRHECAERLREIGFDGYGYGGWPVSEGGTLSDSVEMTARVTPDDRPRFALGIGKPENLVEAFRLGFRMFDCVIPTRDARHRRLYVFREKPSAELLRSEGFSECLYIQDQRHAVDTGPIDPTCDCLACRRYSRGYLHHLFRVGDSLAERLATIHNLRFYRRLIAALAATEATP